MLPLCGGAAGTVSEAITVSDHGNTPAHVDASHTYSQGPLMEGAPNAPAAWETVPKQHRCGPRSGEPAPTGGGRRRPAVTGEG
jgi:hypothetical protein